MIRSGNLEAVSSEEHDLVNRVFGGQGSSEVLRLPERAGAPAPAPTAGAWAPTSGGAVQGGFEEADEVEETPLWWTASAS